MKIKGIIIPEERPEFHRVVIPFCDIPKCNSCAYYMIGRLNSCRRHAPTAIDAQLGSGEVWETEPFIARYYL